MANDRTGATGAPPQAQINEAERLRALADAAFEGLAIHENGVVVYANDAFVRMLGVNLQGIVGKPIFSFAHESSHALLAEKARSGTEEPYEVTGQRADGTQFPAEIQAKTIHVAGRTLRVAAIRDLSDRRRIETALQESLSRSELLFDKAADGIGIARADGTIESYNGSVTRLLGYGPDELVGKSFASIVARESVEARPIRYQELQAGHTVKGERTLICKDGSKVDVELNSSPLDGGRILTIFRDVTERNRLRERLMQSQKLESVGRLAGGIAHDFNNLLTVVLGNIDLIMRHAAGNSESKLSTWAEEILHATTRASELTSQLLTFSRNQVVERTALDLNELIRETERMFRRVIGEDIEVHLDLQPNLPGVLGNRSQLVQVLMNLVLNARDAMPDGGELVLATRSEARRAHHVLLSVRDNGTGMSRETQQRIFEPFFTTKPTGQGTGLGLATVYGVVQQSGGQIDVTSELGVGTTLRLSFPAIEPEPTPAVDKSNAHNHRPEGIVILVVEDEPAVADVARLMLESEGYTVHVALGPREALATLPTLANIDLLITDVVMPHMNGRQLAEAVRQRYPELRVLYASGYTEDILSQKGLDSQALHFLPKPFTAKRLLDKVRDVLIA